jgi:hypothetical protein
MLFRSGAARRYRLDLAVLAERIICCLDAIKGHFYTSRV